MKSQHLNDTLDPRYNSVTGLTNTTFNPSNIVENRMATEAQIKELYDDIIATEQRADYCCRDIVLWETHTQIVRMNTNTRLSNGHLNAGGVVVESFNDNIATGYARRGLPYTVTFAKKWDESLYVNASVAVSDGNNCLNRTGLSYLASPYFSVYTLTHDVILLPKFNCTNNINHLVGGFWRSSMNKGINDQSTGFPINKQNQDQNVENWGSFIREIASDGTVTIKDGRRDESFNIIYYWTQWILRECADGSRIEDITPP